MIAPAFSEYDNGLSDAEYRNKFSNFISAYDPTIRNTIPLDSSTIDTRKEEWRRKNPDAWNNAYKMLLAQETPEFLAQAWPVVCIGCGKAAIGKAIEKIETVIVVDG